MNNKSIKLMGLFCSLLVCFGITIYFYKLNMINYVLVFGVIDLILFGIVMNFIISNRSDESIFNNRVNKIIKTYESILVKSLNVPTLDNKNLVYVETMGNLVDAQSELRKPIYYFLEESCCTFVLKDTEDVLLYIVKVNEGIESSVERDYKVLKKKEEKTKDSIDKKVLEELDKTTVFVINDKMLKVSPVRDKDKLKKEKVNKNTEDNKKLINEIDKVKVDYKDEIKQAVEDKINKVKVNNTDFEVMKDTPKKKRSRTKNTKKTEVIDNAKNKKK